MPHGRIIFGMISLEAAKNDLDLEKIDAAISFNTESWI